jgi:5-methylcytosine-specific restriction endonuclease McrA
MTRPAVIRLRTYVAVPRDVHRRKITRRAVFARDGWTCQYCGSRSSLTVDHVVPRSKGGASSWDNIVASCAPCNRRKGDALPKQVGMRLQRHPRMPGPQVFIHVASPTIPDNWKQYLPEAA